MVKFEVGEKSPLPQMPTEGTYFMYTESGPILILNFISPTDEEISGVKSGKVEIGYVYIEPLIFIISKVAGCGGWMDSPFSIRKYENKAFDFPSDIPTDKGLALQLILIDARTNIIKAMRMIGASNTFTKGFREKLIMQTKSTYSDALYNKTIDKVYAMYSSNALAKRAENLFYVK